MSLVFYGTDYLTTVIKRLNRWRSRFKRVIKYLKATNHFKITVIVKTHSTEGTLSFTVRACLSAKVTANMTVMSYFVRTWIYAKFLTFSDGAAPSREGFS